MGVRNDSKTNLRFRIVVLVLEEIVGIVSVGSLVFGDSLVVGDEEGDDCAIIVPLGA